jgi:hypothetical protein
VAQRHPSLGGNLAGGQFGIAHPLQTAQGRLNNLTPAVTAFAAGLPLFDGLIHGNPE